MENVYQLLKENRSPSTDDGRDHTANKDNGSDDGSDSTDDSDTDTEVPDSPDENAPDAARRSTNITVGSARPAAMAITPRSLPRGVPRVVSSGLVPSKLEVETDEGKDNKAEETTDSDISSSCSNLKELDTFPISAAQTILLHKHPASRPLKSYTPMLVPESRRDMMVSVPDIPVTPARDYQRLASPPHTGRSLQQIESEKATAVLFSSKDLFVPTEDEDDYLSLSEPDVDTPAFAQLI